MFVNFVQNVGLDLYVLTLEHTQSKARYQCLYCSAIPCMNCCICILILRLRFVYCFVALIGPGTGVLANQMPRSKIHLLHKFSVTVITWSGKCSCILYTVRLYLHVHVYTAHLCTGVSEWLSW